MNKTLFIIAPRAWFVLQVHTPLIAIPVEEDNPDNPKGPKRIRIPMSCEGPTTDVDKGVFLFILALGHFYLTVWLILISNNNYFLFTFRETGLSHSPAVRAQ